MDGEEAGSERDEPGAHWAAGHRRLAAYLGAGSIWAPLAGGTSLAQALISRRRGLCRRRAGKDSTMSTDVSDSPVDALDSLDVADSEIDQLLAKWRSDTESLTQAGDDVNTRWERGSAVKLLLQHLAVRESAIRALTTKLSADGHDDLAKRLEGDGVARRRAIAHLDELVRGKQAIVLNEPRVDHAVMALGEIFDRERSGGAAPAVSEVLPDQPAERGLPSARSVRTHAATHPKAEPGRLDDIGPIAAVKALYDHLRGTPHGGMVPSVDEGREHLPEQRT